MKKIIAILLCFAFVSCVFAACNKVDVDEQTNNTSDDVVNTDDKNADDESADNESIGGEIIDDENTDDENTGNENADGVVDAGPVLDLEGVESIKYTRLGEDYNYHVGNDVVSKFMNEPKESFLRVCKFFDEGSYELYGYNELGNLLSATYLKGDVMMHVYWIGGEMNELCVVNSKTAGRAFPPKTPEVTTGENDTVVTQMRALERENTKINGMGYVVRLADGSFIIYDGGYEIRLDELWDTLTTLNGGDKDIVIRAWLLTHPHGDHYPCFIAFSNTYANRVTLERLMICPTSTKDIKSAFNNGEIEKALNRFVGAQMLYVHTGMVFSFCDVKMEILCTADEIYYDGASNDGNNASIVSRVYKEGGKSVMFLGDAGDDVSTRLIPMYGDYLKSDICQAAHHGVEDFTIEAYRLIRAAIWFYPCNTSLYNRTDRDAEVREEIKNAEYTEKIYLHDRRGDRPQASLNK